VRAPLPLTQRSVGDAGTSPGAERGEGNTGRDAKRRDGEERDLARTEALDHAALDELLSKREVDLGI
jgi:hypothetical protein